MKINRDRAKLYGLTLESIYSTLSSFMGTNYVNDFVKFGRTYEVLISGSALSRSQADDVLKLSVRNDKGIWCRLQLSHLWRRLSDKQM